MPKAFVPLHGQPLLRHALDRVLAVPGVRHVVVVAPGRPPRRRAGRVARRRPPRPAAPAQVDVVAGGAERSASVAAGLRALAAEDEIVLVHDAARALAPASLFEAVVAQVRAGSPAVVPGLPVTRHRQDRRRVRPRRPRRPRASALRAIQTPQGFRREVLERAHAGGVRRHRRRRPGRADRRGRSR